MSSVIVGFGEVMLRLAPSGRNRLVQGLPGTLQATFGGGEANVCASLAMLGERARYCTALPDNPISKSFAMQLRGIGVDVEKIHYSANGRMGVYYAEHGADQRGSNVVYDREHSVISEYTPEMYDFDTMLMDAKHLHITGITPALSEEAFLSTLRIAQKASEKGIRISCDLNFRKKLWRWNPDLKPNELAEKCMEQIVQYVDVIIANEEDAADVFGIHASGTSIHSGKLNVEGYQDVARKLTAKFPKASFVAITLRESFSANSNNWGGMLYEKSSDSVFLAPLDEDGEYASYPIRNIVDRFGGGDSFCAGLIYALSSQDLSEPALAIRFAVASSCLKHSIHGDYNYSTKDEVLSLMGGNSSGRVKR